MKNTISISIFLVLIFISSCNEQKGKLEKSVIEQAEETQEDKFYLNCKKKSINGIEFKACIKRPGNFTIINSDKKLVYEHEDNPAEFEFSDFNGDGFSDILLDYFTNVPGIKELLIFNPEKNDFERIVGFTNFPSAIKIKGTDFYYSYHRSGCADNNWDSDLFKIIDNKAIRFGNIKGIGCGIDNENGIYINKVNGQKLEQIKFTPREEGYWDGKWEFIEKYWTKNHNKFE
ncbi:hypothetical protein [Winogradskyella poriferorum]|mgnify:CR=1 FL=1|uniref:VCBS repeat-containing protein n=1 Tax=Winogradskyella poriferorum TaxID=307627 RepID=A0ABU7W3U6_9FLAO